MKINGIETVLQRWSVTLLPNNHIHVVPTNDVVLHEQTEECACVPRTEACLGPDGVVTHYWLVTHSAWDGRE